MERVDGSVETGMNVQIDSEYGKLEAVIVHTPGVEVESMTPQTAEEVLYNEIIPISVVSKEHEKLKSFLSLVSHVYEVRDLLADVLEDPVARGALIQAVARYSHDVSRDADLRRLRVPDLVETLVSGLQQKRDTLHGFLSARTFDIPPLPNLYFMRDGAMAFRDRVLIGSMAHRVRTNEALFMKTLFAYSQQFLSGGILFDGVQEAAEDVTLEGGDFLVVNASTILVGLSERTTAKAVDRLAERFEEVFNEPLTIFAVQLPLERSAIHLDMIFTILDKDVALVYEPLILGRNRVPVYRMDIVPGKPRRIKQVAGVIEGLGDHGVKLQTVLCGGSEPVHQQREQWLSGTNLFAFAPGKVIGYDCNTETFRAAEHAGFAVRNVDDFLSGRDSVDEYDRLLVGLPGMELARGGGGARCMTLPIARAPA